MRIHSKILFAAFLSAALPALVLAQSDLCLPSVDGSSAVPAELRVEQLKIQSQQKNAQDAERRDWQVVMVPVKNSISNSTLRTLCIFRIEVVPQTPGFIALRVPKDTAMLDAIKDAVKMMDVPPPPQSAPAPVKTVELTAYILAASSSSEVQAGWMPLPRELQAVANQLKSVFPNETLYLVDTVLGRGFDRTRMSLKGGTMIETQINIRDGNPPLIRLDNLVVGVLGATFATSLEVPVGAQVVVGKTSSTVDSKKSIVVVMSGKILN